LTFKVELSRRAYKRLENADSATRNRLLEKITELGQNPFPRGYKKLRGAKNAYRIRVGDVRILYSILWSENTILVFKVEPRETVYEA